MVAGDFNGDGILDLAVTNYSGSILALLLGNGSGGLNAATVYSSGGSQPWAAAAGDFNDDGKLDLAVVNRASYNVGVLLNSTTPVVRPLTSAAGTTYQVETGGLGRARSPRPPTPPTTAWAASASAARTTRRPWQPPA